MDAGDSQTNYLKLKEFLARNPAVQSRTFTRWKKCGSIDYLQPGGPNTLILVPEDALERMEQRKRESSDHSPSMPTKKSIPGRNPNWTNQQSKTQN